MSKQTSLKPSSSRDNILSAAKSLLWEIGYDGMSPRRVMERSGAGQGSLYHHFSGKKHLAETALREIEAEMKQSLDTIFSKTLPPLDRVRMFLSRRRNGVKGCRLGRFANETAIAEEKLREPIARFFTETQSHLTNALSEARDRGELAASVDPGSLATTLAAVIQGGYSLSRIHNDPNQIAKAQSGAMALLETAAIQQPKQPTKEQ